MRNTVHWTISPCKYRNSSCDKTPVTTTLWHKKTLSVNILLLSLSLSQSPPFVDARAAPPSLWSLQWCSPDKLAIATAQTRGPSKDGRLLRQNWQRTFKMQNALLVKTYEPCDGHFGQWDWPQVDVLAVVEQALVFEERRGSLEKRFFTLWNIAGFIFEFYIAEKKQCLHLCGCQRVCLRQDTSVLTQLGQLSPQTVAVPGDLIRRTNKNVRLESLSKAHWWDKRGSFPLIICPCFKPPPLWAPWPASRSPPLWWSARGAEGPKVSDTEGEGAAARVGTGSDWSPAPGRLNSR